MSDESVGHLLRARQRDPGAAVRPHRSVELDEAEALRLLGSVGLGRAVFTRHALPAVRPVNHIVAGGDVIVRTHQGSALAAYVRGTSADTVLAYEADVIDSVSHLGWSVVVTGYARLVTDPAELDGFRGRLRQWADQVMDLAVRIHPEMVTGLRLTL
ncbi:MULTISPECIES: pyridoxamine 5'-phosphate oxidase family protein [unclassified Streptomyces]|uniref:pyridoxamine 5'-phosphate oxidase family protein n=1 Tax=unclassified Streptomyces TaxID=2593676 RepID=UPI0029A1FAAA|nr:MULTISPECIES: pyridoxamine 5'-phosphate oxidase family protein [unclassified Streptomyces]MDX3747506.1 pyridoxamine 5'-phosphate oxidase family protein [Streptomyces sp. AK08-02]